MDLSIQSGPLDPRDMERRVASPACGAVVTFVGRVRAEHAGRAVIGLEYQAWPALCRRVAATLGAEIAARWPEARVAAAHRVGRLPVGMPSVVVAVAAPHRAEAYAASQHCIDRIKALLPIWKRERYADGGSAWIGNPEFLAGPGGTQEPA
jgi:molybdopterin synthase catalytic subunit